MSTSTPSSTTPPRFPKRVSVDEDVEMTDDEQMKQRQHMLHSEELSRHMRAQHTNSQNRLHMQNTFQAESPDSPWAQHEPSKPLVDILADRVHEKNMHVTHFTFTSSAQMAPVTVTAAPTSKVDSMFAREVRARHSTLTGSPAPLQCAASSSNMASDDGDLGEMKRAVAGENQQLLASMSENEIMAERAALLQKLDPKLVAYLTRQKHPTADVQQENSIEYGRQDVFKIQNCVQIHRRQQGNKLTQTLARWRLSTSLVTLMRIMPPNHCRPQCASKCIALCPLLCPLSRVAVDPVQFDLALKCQSLMGRSRVSAVLRLFDTLQAECASSATHSTGYYLHSIRKTCLPITVERPRSLNDHELLNIAGDYMSLIRRLYCKRNDEPDAGDDELTVFGWVGECGFIGFLCSTLHHRSHTTSLGSADAHNWRMCDGVQPDTDAHWLTAPLWLMDEKAKQQLSLEQMQEHQLDTVTYCLLFLHALLNTRRDYALVSVTSALGCQSVPQTASLPFAHLYACLLHIFSLPVEITQDMVVFNLAHSIYTEYLMPQLMCPNIHDPSSHQLLQAEAPIRPFVTLETVFTRTLSAVSKHGMSGNGGHELCSQLILVPFYTGCARLCQLLFHTDFAACVRMMTFTNEQQLLTPISFMSKAVTTDCSDAALLLGYASALVTRTLTVDRNALLYTLLANWLRAAMAENEQRAFDARVVAAIHTALNQH